MERDKMFKGQRLYVAEVAEDLSTAVYQRVIVREYVVSECGPVRYRLSPVKGGMSQGGWWRNNGFYLRAQMLPIEAVGYLQTRIQDRLRTAEVHMAGLRRDTNDQLDAIQKWYEKRGE